MAQIVKRGENWRVLVFLNRDASGKRRFHTKTIRGTKKNALQYAREIETALSTGDYTEPTKRSVAEFLADWLDSTAAQKLRPPTLASYRKLVNRYVNPGIGERRLNQLRLPDVDKLYSDMRGRGLSPRTVRYTHSVLRSALNHAVRARLIAHNPTDYATLPRHERKEMRCFSPAEANAFLVASRADRWHALWDLLTMSGLRPGEALGLKWSDIVNDSLSVQRSLVGCGERWTLAEPKTRRSRRTVPLASSTVQALQTHRRQQVEERLRTGEAYADNNLIFANSSGMPLDIRNLTTRHFRKILRSAGLKEIRLYDLRHTAATLMLAAGVNPKVASERLGHSTIVLTMDTYSHVLPDMQQDAVDRVDRLLASVSA